MAEHSAQGARSVLRVNGFVRGVFSDHTSRWALTMRGRQTAKMKAERANGVVRSKMCR